MEVGMEFSRLIPVRTGEIELWGGVSGIWSHTSGSGFASALEPDYEGGRARIESGINYAISSNQNFTAGIYYDGIGARDFEAFGVGLYYELDY
jgi:hypothetical protein